MENFILITAALFTSTLSAMIGMGGGIVLLGLMAILMPQGYLVIALHGMIQLIGNGTRAFIFKDAIKKNIISNYFYGSLIGLSLSGLIVFFLIQSFDVETANEISFDYLKPLIGTYILWFLYLRKKQSTKLFNYFSVGILGGLTSIFIGAVGPLIAPFFLNDELTKENIIANKAACQIITHLGKIPLFIYFFDLNYFDHAILLIPLMLSVYIGTHLGKKLLGYIPERTFKMIFKISLTIIAIKLIFDATLIDMALI